MVSIPFVTWPQAPSKGGQAGLWDELLQLEEKMNMALEQLPTTRVTMDFCCRELELNVEAHIMPEWCVGDWGHKRSWGAGVQLQPMPCNKLTGTMCWCWSARQRPLRKPLGSHASLSVWVPMGHSCTPYSSWPVMWPWPLSMGMSATAQLWAITDRGLILAPPPKVFWGLQCHKEVENAGAIPQTKMYPP